MKEIKTGERAEGYISAVLEYIKKIEEVCSVIMFGSYVKGDLSQSSDVDMLVIVDDFISDSKIKELDSKILSLEEKFGFANTELTFSSRLLNQLSRQTGMFVSHFICRKSAFIDLNFADIFGTNSILTRLLAPKGLVLASMLDDAKTIYGKNLLKEVGTIKINSTELFKSCAMNVLLSIGSIFLAFSKPAKAIRFSMEAIKWSIYSTYYYSNQKSAKLSEINEVFIKQNILNSQIHRLMELRNNPVVDWKFIFFAPWNTIRIHLSYKKLKFKS